LKLTPKGQIILLDFGLAKGSPSQLATRATNTASIFGYSRFYAPLEQIQGSGTDPRSDIYSLAATLYHLMTGVIPPDALSRATAIINGQPDPLVPANEVHAQINSAVGKVLYQAMSQTSASRQASAAILRAELREAATAALTNEKVTRAFDKTPTILDQDTKIMEGSTANTGSIESPPLHGQQTVQMTNVMDVAQVSSSNATVPMNQEISSSNETVAMNPQVISNPTPLLNATATQMDSEVTKLATKVPSQKSSNAIRYVGIAASVILLLTVSTLAYRYAFKNVQRDNALQNINAEQNNINTSQLPEVVNQNANTDTPQTNTSSQSNEQQRKQTPQTSSTKTNNKSSGDNKSEEATQSPQTPKTPNQTADDEHPTNPPPDTRRPAPEGQYPSNMTEAERRRIEQMRRRQMEEMRRRKIEQMKRRQIPPQQRPK
jgi:hypothetical protein